MIARANKLLERQTPEYNANFYGNRQKTKG